MVTGQDHTLVQHNRLAFTGVFHLGVTRHTAIGRSGRIRVGIHQTEFQRSGRTQNFFGARRILDTWQLNDDTIGTLALYQRFGNAELVDTITQDGDVLLHRILTCFAQASVGHRCFQGVAAVGRKHQIALTWRHVADGLVASGVVTEANFHAVVVQLADRSVRNALFTQLAAQGIHSLFLQLAQRGVHVDFHQEVHTTT
ncbi:hypothetical protein D3C79_790130 [compost metagenome]